MYVRSFKYDVIMVIFVRKNAVGLILVCIWYQLYNMWFNCKGRHHPHLWWPYYRKKRLGKTRVNLMKVYSSRTVSLILVHDEVERQLDINNVRENQT